MPVDGKRVEWQVAGETGLGGKPVFSAILLAAGQSVRFGGGKLRALWHGRPLILWAVEAALAAPCPKWFWSGAVIP